MRAVRFALFLAAVSGLTTSANGQSGGFFPGGLSGRVVFSVALWGDRVYAGTDDGVFVHPSLQFGDTLWTPVGLQGKTVRTVYPHQSGAIGYALTAGIDLRAGSGDSVLVYCSNNSDTAWTPSDEGIDRSIVRVIKSIDGFPSPLICGETYAASEGLIYRRTIGGIWEKVFDMGIVVTNLVSVDDATNKVWTGGETAIFAPFVSRSSDKGNTWATSFPDLQGDNACHSLAFDPGDTSVVYAGMEGSVIVSRDGGSSWQPSGLSGTPVYFRSLTINPADQRIYAGGIAQGSEFALYSAIHGDTSWTEIIPPQPYAGILSMLCLPTAPGEGLLLLGTFGDGIVVYRHPVTTVRAGPESPGFRLLRSYPNPFNPSATIEFSVLSRGKTTLRIFDMLGREVCTLFSGVTDAGKVYQVTFRAESLASGAYFYLLHSGNSRTVGKLILEK
jgi:hypothetical protein